VRGDFWVGGGAKGEMGVKKERGRGLLSCSFIGK